MDIQKINSVLVKAIIGLQESEIEAMIEAKAGGYSVPSPSQMARKVKKKSKSKLGVKSSCMKKYRNKKGNFDSLEDCVDAFSSCSKASDPEGVCASLMIHRKQTKMKNKDDE